MDNVFLFKKFYSCFMAYKIMSMCFLCLLCFGLNTYAYQYEDKKYNEVDYQKSWCDLHNGIIEYQNQDFTRVDCLTSTHAVEFDFAKKWAESIGQALHYGLMTGKKPMVVLILNNPQKQMCYYYRVKNIAKQYKFDVEYVTNEIFYLNDTQRHNHLK